MMMTFTNSQFAYNLRGAYEEEYDDETLTKEVIETIVSNYEQQCASHGLSPMDIVGQSRILYKTLIWSSNYNQSIA
jgi:hypothetical protein